MHEAIQSRLAQGIEARRAGDSADALAAYAEAVALSRAANDTASLVQSLKGLGQILRDEGDKPAALERYAEAAAVCRELDDPLLQAHTVRHVADIQRELNLAVESEANYRRALAIYRSHPDTETLDLANAVRGYAVLQTAQDKRADAIALWQEAGELYERVWREPGSRYTRANLEPGINEAQQQIKILKTS